jgi:hypothetical protein
VCVCVCHSRPRMQVLFSRLLIKPECVLMRFWSSRHRMERGKREKGGEWGKRGRVHPSVIRLPSACWGFQALRLLRVCVCCGGVFSILGHTNCLVTPRQVIWSTHTHNFHVTPQHWVQRGREEIATNTPGINNKHGHCSNTYTVLPYLPPFLPTSLPSGPGLNHWSDMTGLTWLV